MSVIHVVGAAIERDGTILAARRSAQMSLPGKWEFPGGKVEAGETPEASLARELREELGIEVEVGEFVASGEVPKGERVIRLDVYLCEWTNGELVAREHDALRWVRPDEMHELEWARADWPAVRALGGWVADDTEEP